MAFGSLEWKRGEEAGFRFRNQLLAVCLWLKRIPLLCCLLRACWQDKMGLDGNLEHGKPLPFLLAALPSSPPSSSPSLCAPPHFSEVSTLRGACGLQDFPASVGGAFPGLILPLKILPSTSR